MRGCLAPVWRETWKHVWAPLLKSPEAGANFAVELFRALAPMPQAPKEPPEPPPGAFDADGVLVDPVALRVAKQYKVALAQHERRLATYDDAANGLGTRAALREAIVARGQTEPAIIAVLEQAFGAADDYAGDQLSNVYFALVERFLKKFSLRYDLRRPFTLHPTLPGVFSGLIYELKQLAQSDQDLHIIFREFEESLRDLTADASEGRIKICIQKQVNLLEALGQTHPSVTKNTLGAMCEELAQGQAWPHASVKDSIKNLYKFACDYPGIRHGGTPASKLREIDMRDMVALTVLLAGFTPYLTHDLNPEAVYRGA